MRKLNASVCAVSHMGVVAEQNEDNLFINGRTPSESELEKGFIDRQSLSEPFVVGVCDGDGGTAASAAAVKALGSHMENLLKSNSSCARIFENCIITANDETNGSDAVTTLSAAYAYEDHLNICVIGNSPVFRYSDGELRQVGGSVSENLKRIGVPLEGDNLVPAVVEVEGLAEDDFIVLCTAGLTGMVPEDRIREILSESDSAQKAATYLVKTALENGGRDNISVIVLQVGFEEVDIVPDEETAIPSVLGAIMNETIPDPTEDAGEEAAAETEAEEPAGEEAQAEEAEESTAEPTEETDEAEEAAGTEESEATEEAEDEEEAAESEEAEEAAEEEAEEEEPAEEADGDETSISLAELAQRNAAQEQADDYENVYSDSGYEEETAPAKTPYGDRPSRKDWILYGICGVLAVLCVILSVSLIANKKARADLQKDLDVATQVHEDGDKTDTSVPTTAKSGAWKVDGQWTLDIVSATRTDADGDGKPDIAIDYAFTDLSGKGLVFDMFSHTDTTGISVNIDKLQINPADGKMSVERVKEKGAPLKATAGKDQVFFDDDPTCAQVLVCVSMPTNDGGFVQHAFVLDVK